MIPFGCRCLLDGEPLERGDLSLDPISNETRPIRREIIGEPYDQQYPGHPVIVIRAVEVVEQLALGG